MDSLIRLEGQAGRGGAIAAAVASVCIGAALLGQLLPSMLAPLAMVGAALLMASIVQPQIAVILVLVFSALFFRAPMVTEGIPVLGGSIKPPDLLLLAALAGWALQVARSRGRESAPSVTTGVALTAFMGLAAVSLLTSHFGGTSLKIGLFELRPLLSYLFVFPLMIACGDERSVRRLLGVVFVVAVAATLLILVRYGRGEGEVASFTANAIRVRSVNFLFPLLVALCPLAYLEVGDKRGKRLALSGVSLLGFVGLYVTLNRAAWLVAGFLMLALLVVDPRRRGHMIGQTVLVVALAGLCLGLAGALGVHLPTNPLANARERISSVGSPVDPSSLYRRRLWSAAAGKIEENPLMGIGLGSSITLYSPMYSDQSNKYGYTDSAYYVENSYLWVALKMGLLAALALVILLIATGRRLLSATRSHMGLDRRFARACLLSLVAIALLSITDQHLGRPEVAPLVAILIVAGEVSMRKRPAAKAGVAPHGGQ